MIFNKQITYLDDVKEFFIWLCDDEGLSFHPDTPFEDYTNAFGKTIYTPEESRILNRLMEVCFTICKAKDEDIYDLSIDIAKKVEINQNVSTRFNHYLDLLFNEVHNDFCTKSGDISPDQQVELDSLTEKMINLITEQVFQNL